VQLDGTSDAYADLLLQLADERGLERLAPFDAATREPPARPVAVTHEQHAALTVDHRPLRAERDPAAHPPDRPEHGGQQRGWA
jgi:hypothetical protein